MPPVSGMQVPAGRKALLRSQLKFSVNGGFVIQVIELISDVFALLRDLLDASKGSRI